MPEKTQILISVLAKTDAIFLPSRRVMTPRHGVVCDARDAYRRRGIRWQSKSLAAADSGGERKQAIRLRSQLEEEGLLEVMRLGSGNSYVRLTACGDAVARARVGLPSVTDSAEWLATVEKRLRVDGYEVADKRWIGEWVLITDYRKMSSQRGLILTDTQVMHGIEDWSLPALTRGWLRSNCDVHGTASYCLECDPVSTLRQAEGVDDKVELPTFEEDLVSPYYSAVLAFQREMDASDETSRNIGDVPLPACR